jgi:uncharacterized protein (TIGR00251 family)
MSAEVVRRRPDGSIEFAVHAVPGGGRSEVVGRHGDALKVRVAAPPEDGRANQAIVELLASALGVRASEVSLVAGGRSRQKRFVVASTGGAAAEVRLQALLVE